MPRQIGGLPLLPSQPSRLQQFESKPKGVQRRERNGWGTLGGLPLRRYRDVVSVPPPPPPKDTPAAAPKPTSPTNRGPNLDLMSHLMIPNRRRAAKDFLRDKARGYPGGFNREYLARRGYRS